MSAEILLRAASLMRERAKVASRFTPPWTVGDWEDGYTIEYSTDNPHAGLVAHCADYANTADAEHIASWNPAVALAVADWLETWANTGWVGGGVWDKAALAVAKAYLGSES